MIQIHPGWLVLLVEAVVLLAVALAAGAALLLARRRRDQRAVRHLVAEVQQRAGHRRAEADALLARLGLHPTRREEALAAIAAAEHRFLRGLIRTYRRRDAAGVAGMLGSLEALVSPYRELLAAAPDRDRAEAAAATAGDPATLAADDGAAAAREHPAEPAPLARLERENAELLAELEASRAALHDLLAQNAALLAGEGEAAPAAAERDDVVVLGGRPGRP